MRRRRATLLTAALALACLLIPASASVAALRLSGSDLSPRLLELAKPAIRSAPPRKQAQALGLAASGPGSLLRQGNRVLVDVRFERGAAAAVDDLRAAGMQVIHVSRRYQTVTVAAKPGELRRLARIGRLQSASEVLRPIVYGVSDTGPVTAAISPPCFGADTSEGDKQLRADKARAEFGIDGNGVKVGILSDSFDRDPTAPTGAAEDVASGDLPGPGNPCGHTTPVEVLEDLTGEEGSDEGRAMAQIVHDLAPGAAVSFATAFVSETGFADNIRALAKKGAKAIVDDIGYFEDPFFQEGPIGVAIGDVSKEDGVSYFSAAGNDNLVDAEGRNIGSWEAPKFREAPACPAGVVALSKLFEEEFEVGLNPEHCMDFDPGPAPLEVDNTFGITVEAEETLILDLQWAEPWQGVSTDLDAYVLNSAGEVVAAGLEDNVFGTQRPVEIVEWENESSAPVEVQLAINRFSGLPAVMPRLKFILLQNGGGVSAIEYPESSEGDIVGPTIFGHGGGEDTMSIGAIRFNTTTKPEFFSSWGPLTHYFGPVKEGVEKALPAAKLEPPQELVKPDVVATDGGANTFFGSRVSNVCRFFGTSAAAPHAAAVAALELQGKPSATAAEVKEAQREAGVEIPGFPPEAVGTGMVDAVGALEALFLTPPFPGAEPAAAPAPAPCPPAREPVTPQPSPSPPILPPVQPPPGSDTRAPEAFFRRHPAHTIRTGARRVKVVFRFGADEDGVEFICRIDGQPFRHCATRIARRARLGRHVVRVKARDAAGNVGTPAVFRFRVRRRG
jgi:subtilisin family serine protease